MGSRKNMSYYEVIVERTITQRGRVLVKAGRRALTARKRAEKALSQDDDQIEWNSETTSDREVVSVQKLNPAWALCGRVIESPSESV